MILFVFDNLSTKKLIEKEYHFGLWSAMKPFGALLGLTTAKTKKCRIKKEYHCEQKLRKYHSLRYFFAEFLCFASFLLYLTDHSFTRYALMFWMFLWKTFYFANNCNLQTLHSGKLLSKLMLLKHICCFF